MANNTLSIYAVSGRTESTLVLDPVVGDYEIDVTTTAFITATSLRRVKNAFKVAYPNAQNVNAVYLGEA